MVRIFSSCINVKHAAYFSDIKDTAININSSNEEGFIQKNDILSIYITSLNNEASSIFNNPNTLSISNTASNGSTTNLSGYLVNTDGNIQIPIIGTIKAEGLTKKELKQKITDIILDKKLLLDPIVNIRQLNYEVTIIGEVDKPSVINVPNEKISLLKALGIAGDITVYGKKNNVLLVREINGKREVKKIDLNSKDFIMSPYYYLQSNDIVYVEPNRQKIISASRIQQLLPTILSALSILAIIFTRNLW
ncbi:MAG: polysaccharide export protein [Ferruginibacter sp.]|nr:polysaccharide export protein [Ferruginibacter sp.]